MRLRWLLAIGLLAGFGCSLLAPYPGGGNPADVVAGSVGADGNSPFDRGDPQEPLIDPAEDASISVISNVDAIVANEGQAFTVDLNFQAQKMNVVGGGIQFEGSDEIQWTFLGELEGAASGDILFGYVIEEGTCAKLPNLCHTINTKQFAVGRNSPPEDVDGDGMTDGDFVVSPPVDVPVILRCASCESPSCVEALEDTDVACASCNQPPLCAMIFDLCFAEGRPLFGEPEADQFDLNFGPDGVTWKNAMTCAVGEELCQAALDGLIDECTAGDTDTDTDTATGG